MAQTSYRRSLHDEILRAAMSSFMAKGVRAVRMDDIAKVLGISKRTLYEIYSNKEELILEVLRVQDEDYIKHMTTFASDSEHNVIDIIMEFYNLQIRWWVNANIDYFEDLLRYRKVKEMFDKKKAEHRVSRKQFFDRGVEEGLFRPDVDYSIFLHMCDASMEYAKKNRLYMKYGMEYLLRNVVLLFIRGICTSRGIERLDCIFSADR